MTVYHEYTGSKTCCITAPHGVFEPMDRVPLCVRVRPVCVPAPPGVFLPGPKYTVRTSHLSASTHPPIQYCSCGLDSTMEFHRGDALHAARTFYRTQALLEQYGGPGHAQPRTPRDLRRPTVHRYTAQHANTASRRQHRKPQHKRSGSPKEAAALTRPTTGREPMPPQPTYRIRAPITSR